MGCSNGKLKKTSSVESYPDSRVPFSKEEILDIQDLWGLTKQKFEDTAKDNLMRYSIRIFLIVHAKSSL